MRRIINYDINESENNLSIEEYLSMRGYPHAVFVRLKATENSILVNGRWCYLRDLLHTGDKLCITLEDNSSSEGIIPVELPLHITYEDEDILIINKNADTPIHPSRKNYENTLANGVMAYYKKQGLLPTFRCINRLDRDTTGLTIIAKHMLSAGILSRDMTKRAIHREYLAIVEGITDSEGTIDTPIGRKSNSTIERCVDLVGGERAITHYKRIATRDHLSLIRLHLDTGRTHQIRVHMASIGHPLIGDSLYNPHWFTSQKHFDAKQAKGSLNLHLHTWQQKISRQALHSYRLTFTHPVSGQPMTLTCPLPEDMASYFPNITIV